MFRDLLTVTVKEIRDLARDKRTLLTAIALPLLLFPLAFALLDLNANRNDDALREPAICAARDDAAALRALHIPALRIIKGEDIQADLLARRCDLWLARDTDNSMIFYHDASGRAPLRAAQRALETLQQASTAASQTAPVPQLLPVGDPALARLQLVFSTLLPCYF
jgi:hypothetical protein